MHVSVLGCLPLVWVTAEDRSIEFPRVRITGSREPSNMGTGNRTQALW